MITLRNSGFETIEFHRKQAGQDSEFVRWSSTFHRVLVFTVTNICVLFIGIIGITCRQKLSCVKMYFPCLSGTIRHSLVLQSKYTRFGYLY